MDQVKHRARFRGKPRYNVPTPPQWMRHFIPWALLDWINDHYGVCWAQVVYWKMGLSEDSWSCADMCFEPSDYCGKWDVIDGKPQVPGEDND